MSSLLTAQDTRKFLEIPEKEFVGRRGKIPLTFPKSCGEDWAEVLLELTRRWRRSGFGLDPDKAFVSWYLNYVCDRCAVVGEWLR